MSAQYLDKGQTLVNENLHGGWSWPIDGLYWFGGWQVKGQVHSKITWKHCPLNNYRMVRPRLTKLYMVVGHDQ